LSGSVAVFGGVIFGRNDQTSPLPGTPEHRLDNIDQFLEIKKSRFYLYTGTVLFVKRLINTVPVPVLSTGNKNHPSHISIPVQKQHTAIT
jgi:hypothetical protein